jgi:hypothetical protein
MNMTTMLITFAENVSALLMAILISETKKINFQQYSIIQIHTKN